MPARTGSRAPGNGRTLLVVALVAAALGALGAGVWVAVAGGRDGDAGGGGPIATLRTADFHALAWSPGDLDTVYFGHHDGVMKSADAGRGWTPSVAQRNFDAMALAVSGVDPQRLLMAGHDVFFTSGDGGATWQPLRHGMPGTDIHGFAMSPSDAQRLYAYVVGFGLWNSVDGGSTWRPLSGQLPGDVHGLVAAGGEAEILYAASMSRGVLRSSDGGRSWAETGSGTGPQRAVAVAAQPGDPQTVYAGTDGGLYKSVDGGSSWRKLPFPGPNAVALAISPLQPNRILAIAAREGQGLVYRSDDGGQTWPGGA